MTKMKDEDYNKEEDEGTPVEETLKIEDLYMELGDYSWFQFLMTLILIFPEMPAGSIGIAPVFVSTSRVMFNCESIENGTYHTKQFMATNPELCSSNCSVISASAHVAQFSSIVQEWNLVCDRAWIADAFTSVQMFGMMTGCIVGSISADRIGRKLSYFCTTLLMALFGIASGLAPNVYLYAISRYFAGLFSGAFYVVYSIYLIEFLTPSWRTLCGCISVWFLGELLLTLTAYLVPHWRTLLILTSAPGMLVLLALWILPESPRFLLCKNETDKAKTVFDQIARYNSRPLVSPEKIQKLQDMLQLKNQTDRKPTVGRLNFLGSAAEWIRLGIFIWAWFSAALVYYGITFNTKNFSGDPYLNVLYMALVDMPSFPSGAIFNNWLGRKRTFCYLLMFGAVFLVSIVVLEEAIQLHNWPTVVTILCYLGRFGVGGAWAVAFCFTAESFPTVVRSTCLGLCQLAANLGGVVAPFIAFFGLWLPTLPYIIFCGVTVLAAVLSYFLEETNSKPLKDLKQ